MAGMGQTSYPTSLPVGYAGMLADNFLNQVETAFNDESIPIPFGIGLVKNSTGDKHYRLPSAATDRIDGLGVFTHSINRIGSAAWKDVAGPGAGYQPGIPAGYEFGLLVHGRIYVIPEVDVSQDDPVYCRFAPGSAAGASDQAGAFRNALDNLAAWQTSTAYHAGDRVISNGNLYEYTTAGTSDGTNAPSATTTAADSITDGTAKCRFVQAQATGASNFLVKGALFVLSAKAGHPVPVHFDKLLSLS